MLRDVNIINTSSVKNMQSVNKNIALDIPISVEQKKLNNEKVQRKLRQIFYIEKKQWSLVGDSKLVAKIRQVLLTILSLLRLHCVFYHIYVYDYYNYLNNMK